MKALNVVNTIMPDSQRRMKKAHEEIPGAGAVLWIETDAHQTRLIPK